MKNGEYTLIVAPEDYPGKWYRGRYAYEHHVIYWRSTGLIPGRGQVIHHKNEDKRDNRPENLELITVQEHNKRHPRPRSYITVVCGWCREPFQKWRRYVKPGQTKFFCCRSHQVREQQAVIRGSSIG